MVDLEPIQYLQNKQGEMLYCSVIGARHQMMETLCQDASRAEGHNNSFFMAVADGHGDAKHSNSHIGSKIAVESCLQVLKEAFESVDDKPHPAQLQYLQEQVEKRIRWKWNSSCLNNRSNSNGAWTEELITYGTTILAAYGNHESAIFFQLGDGEILWKKQNGIGFVFEDEDTLYGTVTHSLCQPYQPNQSRMCWLDLRSVEMILLCTDGLGDCLQGDRDSLMKVIPWISKLMDDKKDDLPKWLNQISQKGNGDDISVAVYRKMNKETPICHS